MQHGFVEGSAEEKYSQLTEDLEHLCMQKVDQIDIEELLESAAYHDFNFIDEDESFKDLAKAIVSCLKEIQSEDLNQAVTKHFPSATEALKKSVRGENRTVRVEESEALSEMFHGTSIQEENCDTEQLRRPKPDPVIDEDGFELVQSRRKR
jgi:hypothetical protein